MFDDLTKRKKTIPEKLISYGFKKAENCFKYSTDIFDEEFSLTVQIDFDGYIDTNLIEKEIGEEYILYKTNASGKYIGEIRLAIDQVLNEIVNRCFEASLFKSRQSQMIIEFIREIYEDELEFLWSKFPDNAVCRRKDSKKWYGAILTVEGKKIGLETEKKVEIIDLRMNPAEADIILSKENYYPGWHMNKKSWYTIVLNGSVPDYELKEKITESYKLAK